jgi:hypothetical protein
MRPKQWVKNGFVFFGLLFGHAWHNRPRCRRRCWPFAAFCLMSSAVYALNDLRDIEQDRLHPVKRLAAAGVRCAVAVGGHPADGGLLRWRSLLLAPSGRRHARLSAVRLRPDQFRLQLRPQARGGARRVHHQRRLHAAPAGRHHRSGHSAVELAAHVRPAADPVPRLRQAARGNDADGGGRWRAPQGARSLFAGAARPVHHHHRRMRRGGLLAVHRGCRHRAHPRDGRSDLHPAFRAVRVFRYLYMLHRRGGGGDPSHDLFRDPHLVVAMLGWLAVTVFILR